MRTPVCDSSLIIRDIHRGIESYLWFLEQFSSPAPFQRFQIEDGLANAAQFLCRALAELKALAPDLPRAIDRAIATVGVVTEAHLARWGWPSLVGPEGSHWIAERLKRHREEKEIPYLQAVHSWRSSDTVEANSGADLDHDRAKALGIEPDSSHAPDEWNEIAKERHARWVEDLALGKVVPEATSDEWASLRCSLDAVGRYLRNVESEATLLGSAGETAQFAESDETTREVQRLYERFRPHEDAHLFYMFSEVVLDPEVARARDVCQVSTGPLAFPPGFKPSGWVEGQDGILEDRVCPHWNYPYPMGLGITEWKKQQGQWYRRRIFYGPDPTALDLFKRLAHEAGRFAIDTDRLATMGEPLDYWIDLVIGCARKQPLHGYFRARSSTFSPRPWSDDQFSFTELPCNVFKASAWAMQQKWSSVRTATVEGWALPASPPTPQGGTRRTPSLAPPNAGVKTKRSTDRCEGQAKIIAVLTKHHQYADGSCLNQDPIGNNELARAAEVSRSTASEFFKDKFRGHGKYMAICRDAKALVGALKLLNGEFSPHLLYGQRPPGEEDSDGE